MWFARSCEGRTQTPEGGLPACGDVRGRGGDEAGEPPARPDRMQYTVCVAEMSVNTHPDVAPPYLYIPVWLDEEGIVQISIADGAQKEKILLAYTALDRLLDALGDKQPWAAIPTSKLSTIKEETGYTHLVVDYYVSNIVRKISEYEGWPKGQHRRVSNRTQTNLYNRSGRIGPLGSHHATGNRRQNRNIHHYRYAWRSFN